MPTGDVAQFPRDVQKYTSSLDRLTARRRAPRCVIPRNESDPGLTRKTAAHRYQPGQYKIDRDFPMDVTSEVRKGVLSGSATVRHTDFNGQLVRTDKDGVLRGIRNPGNGTRWFNPTCPGQYEEIDCTGSAKRSCWPSAPAYSVEKGEAQETVRERKKTQSTPPPGTYELPSKFDQIGKERAEAFQKLVKKSSTCRWEGQFSHIFHSIHASAKQSRHSPAKPS
eukprot:TRINITY_DN12588_c0_g1_i1.p1 TRINITY_DN12588_c0_g1~~TRINITY_DN12588_c0_g1_i1.p1  ORF type:complete len:223 (-),score=48.19 TRINITY_DN12588_c0_g1_i1:151-819(-)